MSISIDTSKSADDQLTDLHAQLMARMRSPVGLTLADMAELKVGVGVVKQSIASEALAGEAAGLGGPGEAAGSV